MLSQQMETLAKKPELSANTDIDSIVTNDAIPDAIREMVVKQYGRSVALAGAQHKIMDRWRQVVFNTCIVAAGSEEERNADEKPANPHFRTIEKAEDLTDEEVLEKVYQLKAALERDASGHSFIGLAAIGILDFGAEIGEPKNCPQAPRWTQSDVFID
jgi:hypothetical protein